MGQSIDRLLKALARELASLDDDMDIDDDMDRAVRASPVWREKENLLVSVPGVGPVIARTLIAELPELGSLDRRAARRPRPMDPAIWTRQSGRWRGKSFIGGGRTAVRTVLYLGALLAARHNPALEAFRDRLVAQGKPKIVAVIATARKLLTILNAVIREKTPWRTQSA